MELVDYIERIVSEINSKTNEVTKITGLSEVIEMLRSYDVTRGKKLRSVICALVCDTLGGNHKAAIDYALAIELTHQASLIHDDVIDGDMFRRGRLTFAERYGVGRAIIVGDMLASFAISAIKDMSPFEFALGARHLAPAWRKLAEGAYLEHVFSEKPTIEKYYKVIEYKTASLFEVASKLGVVASGGGQANLDRFGAYGLACGMAFQMTDDLVDVLKSRSSKKFVGDLAERSITLPILAAMVSGESEALQKYLRKEQMTDEQQSAFLTSELIEKGISEAKNLVEGTVNSARKCVSDLPVSEYKDVLMEIPEYIVQSLMLEVKG